MLGHPNQRVMGAGGVVATSAHSTRDEMASMSCFWHHRLYALYASPPIFNVSLICESAFYSSGFLSEVYIKGGERE